MEVDYKKSDVQEYREWLESIGEDPRNYTVEQILKALEQDA